MPLDERWELIATFERESPAAHWTAVLSGERIEVGDVHEWVASQPDLRTAPLGDVVVDVTLCYGPLVRSPDRCRAYRQRWA